MSKFDRAKQRLAERKRRNAPPMPKPPRLDEWLKCLFGRLADLLPGAPISHEDPSYFHREAEYEFLGSDAEVGELFIYTMRNAEQLLANSSNIQVAGGLKIIFDNGIAEICFQLLNSGRSVFDKQVAINSVYHLYSDVFAKRCSPILGQFSEEGDALSSICYMLWDVTPLTGWCGILDPTTKQSTLVEMLEKVPYIQHDACIKSALHGLGHLVISGRASIPNGQISTAIQRFLLATPNLRPELRRYAEYASVGRVQ
jgi:hypothetical protein